MVFSKRPCCSGQGQKNSMQDSFRLPNQKLHLSLYIKGLRPHYHMCNCACVIVFVYVACAHKTFKRVQQSQGNKKGASARMWSRHSQMSSILQDLQEDCKLAAPSGEEPSSGNGCRVGCAVFLPYYFSGGRWLSVGSLK